MNYYLAGRYWPFDIFYTKEQIQDIIKESNQIGKKGKYQTATKDNIKVVFTKESEIFKIITFYPIK